MRRGSSSARIRSAGRNVRGPGAACMRWLLYVAVGVFASGCVPVGVRVQNMFAAVLG
jgi:hypothetical protein